MSDGVYPNDKGHELVGERLGQFFVFIDTKMKVIDFIRKNEFRDARSYMTIHMMKI